MAFDEEGEPFFGKLDAGGADASGNVDLPHVGPAVVAVRGPAAATSQEEVPDELASRAGVDAGHGVAQAAGEAGGNLVGYRLGQRLEYRLNNLLSAVIGAHAHRGGGIGVDHQPLGRNHLHRPGGPFVPGNVGGGQVHYGGVGQGAGIGVGAVDEPGHLGAGLPKVDGHGVALDGYLGPDGNQLVVEAVVVHQRLAPVNAVGPLGDELPYLFFRGGQDVVDRRREPFGTVALQQRLDALLGNHHGPYLGVQVAEEVLRLPDVGRNHL